MMCIRHLPLLPLLLCPLFLSGMLPPALAVEGELAPGYNQCIERSGEITSSLQECNDAAATHWDGEASASLKARAAQCAALPPDDAARCRKNLDTAHTAWASYRDNMAPVLYYRNGGGTMHSPLEGRFRAAEARRHALALRGEATGPLDLGPSFAACRTLAGGAPQAELACLKQAHAVWDEQLNRHYKLLQKDCGMAEDTDRAECRKSLLQAQRAWITYRDGMAAVARALAPIGRADMAGHTALAAETRRQAQLLATREDNDEPGTIHDELSDANARVALDEKQCTHKKLRRGAFFGVFLGEEGGDYTYGVFRLDDGRNIRIRCEDSTIDFYKAHKGERLRVDYETQRWWISEGDLCAHVNICKGGGAASGDTQPGAGIPANPGGK